MKYQCLILDHDDTTVDSTSAIHYPAHLEIMKRLRPNHPVINLETWFLKNFSPGIMRFLTEELHMTEEEMAEEFKIWQQMNEARNPPFYKGMPELLRDFSRAGGIIAVVSHSTEHHIRRHYKAGAPDMEPELIFGWEHDADKRKPAPWPLEQILEKTGIRSENALMVDDLKPGVEMAKTVGVPIAAAGWGHSVPEIRETMNQLCDYWLPDIESLRNILEL